MFCHLVVSRHHFERLFFPTPIFKHLTWGLEEVSLDMVAGKSADASSGANKVHYVTELVKEGHHLESILPTNNFMVIVQKASLFSIMLRRPSFFSSHSKDV